MTQQTTDQQTTEQQYDQAKGKLNRLVSQYLESTCSLWDNYVDPREAYLGENGEPWRPIGGGGMRGPGNKRRPYETETELWEIQDYCRWLSEENEFAINGHENRISYLVGWGHQYTVTGKDDHTPPATVKKVQAVVDQWLKLNKWMARQQEIILRWDRDGEVFLRSFPCEDGYLRVRFVEPVQVHAPDGARPYQSFGVENLPGDVETIVAYHIDSGSGKAESIDASYVQHRKANVDSGWKRGMPMFYPVRKNLRRASNIQRNMSMATEIQNAIALIRKHEQASKQAVKTFLNTREDGSTTKSNGRSESVLHYGPGSILDAPMGTQYDFPKGGLDASKTISALQSELRAVASRLVFPEFMLTSDASNANFSSTMVAEGPAVRKFQRDQYGQIEFDLELIDRALAFAVESGLLTPEELQAIQVDAEPPGVHVRDRLQEAQVRQIDMMLGILSPQTATAERGNGYETEQSNIEQHSEREGGPLTGDRPELPGLPGEDDEGGADSVSATAMNGIQIQTLQGILMSVVSGELRKETAMQLLRVAFPLIPELDIEAMLTTLEAPDTP